VEPHFGYQDVFEQDRRRTHIRSHTALVRDRMVWNKVFRRSFWNARDLVFTLPEYEDAPVMIRAHIEASSVDVVSEVVYFWRIREEGMLSITQWGEEPENIAARMRMVLDTFEVITDLAPELVPRTRTTCAAATFGGRSARRICTVTPHCATRCRPPARSSGVFPPTFLTRCRPQTGTSWLCWSAVNCRRSVAWWRNRNE
jgi:hypothetical protein